MCSEFSNQISLYFTFMANESEIEPDNPPQSDSASVQQNANNVRLLMDSPTIENIQANGINCAEVQPTSNNEKPNDKPTSDTDFLSKIHSLHCPFTWNPEEHLKTYRRDEIEDIMGVDQMFEETGFKLRRFVIHLILTYNNYCKRMLEESVRNLDEMEKMLLASLKNKSRDVYFVSINDALFHIMQSCRVVMLNATNRKEKALQILRKITPYDEMNDCNKAGIWAVRANLYVEFGYDGVKAAIEYMKKATEIDNKNPYWYFMNGVYLGRLRRLESGFAIPSVDEIVSLEYAMKLKEDASFFAFAAEVYGETADRTMKHYHESLVNKCQDRQKKEILKKNDLLNKHAAMLFKKSVELNPNCAHLLFRCGKGLLRLPPPYQDIKLAHKYLKSGLEISYESSYGNHAMAMYYEKYEENNEVAKKYLKKAVEHRNFGADLDLIRIRYLENRDSKALLNSLKKLFEIYPDGVKHRKILAEIISYYLFLDYNLSEAINYMKKLLYLMGDNDEIVHLFKSGILRQKLPYSLLAVLLSDITDGSKKEILTSEEQELCKTFLDRLCNQNIPLPPTSGENLRKKIAREVQATFKAIDGRSVKRQSKSPTKIEPVEKEYDPVPNRFTKEYVKKYYIDKKEENEQTTKTVVEEFFQKYEAEVRAKGNKINDKPSTSANYYKPKKPDVQEEAMNPTVQKLFENMKKSKKLNLHPSDDSDSESDHEKKDVYRLAKQFEHRFNISPEKSNQNNDRRSRSNSRHRRRSEEKSDQRRKRSTSRETHRSSKPSHRNRSVSRDSRKSTKPSTDRNRSISRESRKSTKPSSRRNRSVSRESHKSSRRNRSASRESYKSSRRNRSASRESYKSRRNRSASRESYKSSRRNRSPSRESYRSRRNRSRSRQSHKSFKRDRYNRKYKRSDSEESRSTDEGYYRNRREKRDHRRKYETSSSEYSDDLTYSDSDSSDDHRRSRRSRKTSPTYRKGGSYKKHREDNKSRKTSKKYDNSDTDDTSHSRESHNSSKRSPARESNRHRRRSVSSERLKSKERCADSSNSERRRKSPNKKFSSTETLKDSGTNSESETTKKRTHSREGSRSKKTSDYKNDRHKHSNDDDVDSGKKRSTSRESRRSSKSAHKSHHDDHRREISSDEKCKSSTSEVSKNRASDQHSEDQGTNRSDEVGSRQSRRRSSNDTSDRDESEQKID